MSENISRRSMLQASLGVLGVVAGGSAFGSTLVAVCGGKTPQQTEGPFYPVKDQPDKDNDLTYVKGRADRARGQVIYILGQVTDESCQPVSRALVEIWQACESGRYNHPGDDNPAPLDPDFQYWGRALTDANGRYSFKTILPGAYPADHDWIRPPHIHYKVHRNGFRELTTQMYFEGQPLNSGDKILRAIPAEEQGSVVVRLENPDSPEFDAGSKVCRFDLTLERA